MTMTLAYFTSEIANEVAIHKWDSPAAKAELTAIYTPLTTDPTTHDETIEVPPAGLRPGNSANTRFQNDILLHVNTGKGANLTNIAMANAINAVIATMP